MSAAATDHEGSEKKGSSEREEKEIRTQTGSLTQAVVRLQDFSSLQLTIDAGLTHSASVQMESLVYANDASFLDSQRFRVRGTYDLCKDPDWRPQENPANRQKCKTVL